MFLCFQHFAKFKATLSVTSKVHAGILNTFSKNTLLENCFAETACCPRLDTNLLNLRLQLFKLLMDTRQVCVYLGCTISKVCIDHSKMVDSLDLN